MTHQRLMRLLASLMAVAVVAAGCGDELTGGDGNDVVPTIAVTAGSGTTPSYSWVGVGAFSVTVARTSNPTVPVWGILTPGADGIVSPVTHGTTPPGAIRTANTEATLTAGVRYRVEVRRIAEDAMGFAELTP